MQDESPEAFHQLLDDHLVRLGPIDGVEFGFVEEMTAAAWRLRRSWAVETRMLDNEAADSLPPDVSARFSRPPPRVCARYAKLAAEEPAQ